MAQNEYPDPLELPPSYQRARALRKEELSRSIWRGVGVRSLIIIAEFVGFFVFGSFSLLFDALASTVDIGSSLFLLLGIKMAQRAPDEDHPFGHGRIEPLAGLLLALFMVAGGFFLVVNQFYSLTSHPSEEIISGYAWLIPFGAVILLELCYHMMRLYAKKNHSAALMADAVHFRIDALNSGFACIALIIAALFPLYSGMIDHIGALLIAALTVLIGLQAARNNIHQLLDRKPEEDFFERVRAAAASVEGVLGTEKLNIQLFGPDAHVDIDIEVDPAMRVDNAHEICQKVRVEIQKVWPAVRDVIVHVEPFYENDH